MSRLHPIRLDAARRATFPIEGKEGEFMTLTITTPPAVEPVTLDEAKAQLRVTYDQEDALIGSLITAARQRIEAELGIAMIATGVSEVHDVWPLEITTAVPVTDPLTALFSGPIRLRRGPLLSVADIGVADGTGTFQTVNPLSYAAEVGSRPGRVAPYDVAWPSPGVATGGVRIDYVAGYGAAESDVPAPLRQAILMLVADGFEHRNAAARL
jgi:uncharacterized phiE125 gp8 family phage protein